MRWLVDYHSGVPVYLQLVQQAQAAIATGAMHEGEQLPSVRVLAESLKVNRNTIAKAWAELEREGIIENRQGAGCFVRGSVTPLKKAARNERLSETIDALLVQAHHLQVDDDDLRGLLDERLKHFHRTRRTAEGAAK